YLSKWGSRCVDFTNVSNVVVDIRYDLGKAPADYTPATASGLEVENQTHYYQSRFSKASALAGGVQGDFYSVQGVPVALTPVPFPPSENCEADKLRARCRPQCSYLFKNPDPNSEDWEGYGRGIDWNTFEITD